MPQLTKEQQMKMGVGTTIRTSPANVGSANVGTLKPADNAVNPSVNLLGGGSGITKQDMFSGNPVTTPQAITSPDTFTPPVSGSFTPFFTSSSGMNSDIGTGDFMDESSEPLQKKVSSWLGKFLPTVETDVNFPDKKPIYIIGIFLILAVVLFKLIKKR